MAKYNRYRRKVKYKKLEFKLTDQQYSLLEQYCDIHELTPVKAIKKVLLNQLESEEGIVIQPKEKPKTTSANKTKGSAEVSKQQLNLFDLIEAERASK